MAVSQKAKQNAPKISERFFADLCFAEQKDAPLPQRQLRFVRINEAGAADAPIAFLCCANGILTVLAPHLTKKFNTYVVFGDNIQRSKVSAR